jgi:basic amino acid/polyamine antiporter, APA family
VAGTVLSRELGLRATTLLVVGQVIAVGIFLTPAEMTRTLASPAWVLAVWLVMGVMALSGACCFAELAARFPEAGGGYVYLRETYGPLVAFLYGWKCFLVMDPGLTAALAMGVASYVGYIVPLGAAGAKAVALGAIALLASVNVLGIRLSTRLMMTLAILKLALLAAIVTLGFGLGQGDWSHFVPFASRPSWAGPLGPALAAAFVSAFFAFGGWWETGKMAGEVRDPARTLPRALMSGLAVVTLVYVVTSAVFVYLVPMDRVESGETFAAQAGEVLFGRSGGVIFSGVVVVSILGSLMAFLMMAPRVYYAMARDGLFPSGVAALHPRFGTPARAIAAQAILASLIVFSGTFTNVIAYFVFITVLFIGLTVAGVYVLHARDDGHRPAFMVPGYPVTPLIFLALVVLLLVLLVLNNPRQALAGAAVVLLGVPVYLVMIARRSPLARSFAGREP